MFTDGVYGMEQRKFNKTEFVRGKIDCIWNLTDLVETSASIRV